MASITSSSDLASAWMSSRSIGVTNVRFRRWMISCVSASHSCSICLICSAVSQAGGSEASIRSSSVGAGDDLVGQGDEIGVELLFAGDQAEAHAGKYVTGTLH